ncbi:UNVERIFIED_CONTAM: hypothetical protein Sindi_2943300 [Sesamum indicum]
MRSNFELKPRERVRAESGRRGAISFSSSDKPEETGEMNDPIVIRLDIANFTVHKVLVDSGSSADIIFKNVIDKMGLENLRLEPVKTPLVGFGGSEVNVLRNDRVASIHRGRTQAEDHNGKIFGSGYPICVQCDIGQARTELVQGSHLHLPYEGEVPNGSRGRRGSVRSEKRRGNATIYH